MKRYIVQYRVNNGRLETYGGNGDPILFNARSPAGAIAQVTRLISDIDAQALDIVATEYE